MGKASLSKKECAATNTTEAFRIARQCGFMALNDNERALIETLRWTTWHGRDMVYEFAIVAQRLNPWTDDGSERNTYQSEAVQH